MKAIIIYTQADTADIARVYHFGTNENVTAVKGYDFVINSNFIIRSYNNSDNDKTINYNGIQIKVGEFGP